MILSFSGTILKVEEGLKNATIERQMWGVRDKDGRIEGRVKQERKRE